MCIRDSIYASWLVSLALAYKDEGSICMNEAIFASFTFSYKTWLIIDGFTTLGILVAMVIRNLIWCKDVIKMDCICFSYGLIAMFTLFKVGWILIGLMMYLTLVFEQCTPLLKSFGTVYYLTFLYFFVSVIVLNL